jgi:hypothetical protein
MLTKGKCNGERPACKACHDRDQPCQYSSEPGITPVAALKRKYESLQAESADEHKLLGFLRTGEEEEAIRVLAYLRSSDDVQATLHQAQHLPDGSGGLAASNTNSRQSTNQAPSHSSLQVTRASINSLSTYPELGDIEGGLPWALPIEPYVC